MTTLRIFVTKEVLEQSAYCGIDPEKQYKNKDANNDVKNCAIACAVDKIIPNASVTHCYIGVYPKYSMRFEIPIYSQKVVEFITDFDTCKDVKKRMAMEPFNFDIEVTDEQLEEIMKLNNFNEEEFKAAINECKTMSLIEK